MLNSNKFLYFKIENFFLLVNYLLKLQVISYIYVSKHILLLSNFININVLINFQF